MVKVVFLSKKSSKSSLFFKKYSINIMNSHLHLLNGGGYKYLIINIL